MFKTRAKQLLRCPYLSERPEKMGTQRLFASMRAIRQFPFPMCPNLLNRIHLWRISGEPVRYDSFVFFKERAYCLASMNFAPIPYQYYWSALMTHQVLQKHDYIVFFDVVSMHTDIESKTPYPGRHRKNRNGRNPVPAITVSEQWCTADRSPRFMNIRNKQEPAFVQQVEMGTKSFDFFLYVAIFSSSNLRWPLHPAPMPSVPAFDNSTQDRSGASSIPLPRYTEHYNTSESTGQFVPVSKVPWNNLLALPLSATVLSSLLSVCCSICWVVPMGLGSLILSVSSYDTFVPTVRQNLTRLSQSLKFSGMFSRFSIKQWLENVFSPIPWGFHVVSCI